MHSKERTPVVVVLGLLLGLAWSGAYAANACNQFNISWQVTVKSARAVNARQLAKEGSAPNYIAAIKKIESANNGIMAQFAKKSRTLRLPADDRGYLTLKRIDREFINTLSRKQRPIAQRLLDLIANNGLPVPEKVGIDGAMSAFTVMANTFDPADAAKFADLWQSGCAKGVLPCPAYALIKDNALMVRAGIQKFGTALGVPFAKGTNLVQLNEERATVGLGPLSGACMLSISKP